MPPALPPGVSWRVSWRVERLLQLGERGREARQRNRQAQGLPLDVLEDHDQLAALLQRRDIGFRQRPRRCTAACVAMADRQGLDLALVDLQARSEEHTSELQSLMRTSYAVFCLKKKK